MDVLDEQTCCVRELGCLWDQCPHVVDKAIKALDLIVPTTGSDGLGVVLVGVLVVLLVVLIVLELAETGEDDSSVVSIVHQTLDLA